MNGDIIIIIDDDVSNNTDDINYYSTKNSDGPLISNTTY